MTRKNAVHGHKKGSEVMNLTEPSKTYFRTARSKTTVPTMEKDTVPSMLTIKSALKDNAFNRVRISVSRKIRVSTTHLLMSLRLTPNLHKWCRPQFFYPQTNGGVCFGPVLRVSGTILQLKREGLNLTRIFKLIPLSLQKRFIVASRTSVSYGEVK